MATPSATFKVITIDMREPERYMLSVSAELDSSLGFEFVMPAEATLEQAEQVAKVFANKDTKITILTGRVRMYGDT